ncbi:MAG: DUF739 family protein [Anaerotignaceae bacterium]
MAFNYSKLKGRIVEKFGSQTAFVKAFGVSENTFSLKMNNKVRFTTDDITRITRMLDIPEEAIGEYFFTLKV